MLWKERRLRNLSELKRKEVIEEWIKRYSEKLQDFLFVFDMVRIIKTRRMRWVGRVARRGVNLCVFRVFLRKSEVNRLFGRHMGWRILKTNL